MKDITEEQLLTAFDLVGLWEENATKVLSTIRIMQNMTPNQRLIQAKNLGPEELGREITFANGRSGILYDVQNDHGNVWAVTGTNLIKLASSDLIVVTFDK